MGGFGGLATKVFRLICLAVFHGEQSVRIPQAGVIDELNEEDTNQVGR
jgi:hypothetical protein